MKEWFARNSLAPEYARAVDKLVSILRCPIKAQHYITGDILNQGAIQKVLQKFTSKSIPAGTFWGWNQAKSRKKVELPIGYVTFYKLTPRKRQKKPIPDAAPNYKLWQFCIKPKDKITKPFHILWCEKGVTAKVQSSEFTSDFVYPIHSGNAIQSIFSQYGEGDKNFVEIEIIKGTAEQSYELPSVLNQNPLSIEDYSFLAPFMDDKFIALELWPDNSDFDCSFILSDFV